MAQKRGSCSRGTPIPTTAPKGPSYGVEVLTLLIASFPRSCCARRAQSQGRSGFVSAANLIEAVEPTAGVLGVPRREKSPPGDPTAFPVPRNGRAAAYLRLAVPGALCRFGSGLQHAILHDRWARHDQQMASSARVDAIAHLNR